MTAPDSTWRDRALKAEALVTVHEHSLDGALAALAGAGIGTPEETFKRAPTGCLGSCIRNLRDDRDALAKRCASLEHFLECIVDTPSYGSRQADKMLDYARAGLAKIAAKEGE